MSSPAGEVTIDRSRAECPVVHGYDPMDPAVVADPGPWLDVARRECPVFFVPERDEWVVTRFADLEQILSDTESYSTVQGLVFPEPPAEIKAEQPDGRWAIRNFLEMRDPPEHGRVRRLYAPAFSLKQAKRKSEWMSSLTNRLIDEIAGEGEADLVSAYFNRIPVSVICNILGAPEADAPQMYRWMLSVIDLFSNPAGEGELLRVGREVLALERYVTGLIAERRRSPREDDFLSILLTTPFEDDGSPIGDRLAVGLVIDLIFAGSDTSASAMGLITHRLLSERHLWQQLLEDREQLESYVEEGLRIGNPVRGSWRVTKREVELGGAKIPVGSVVRTHTWSGGFDGGEFPCPHEFRPDRENVRRHITFGRGPNQCPGAFIARTEIKIAIETLLERLPSLELVEGHRLEFTTSLFVPTLLSGVVARWDER